MQIIEKNQCGEYLKYVLFIIPKCSDYYLLRKKSVISDRQTAFVNMQIYVIFLIKQFLIKSGSKFCHFSQPS